MLVKTFVFALVLLLEFSQNFGVIIRTNYGQIRGYTTSKSRIFLGVPYASPPERWQDAKKLRPWKDTLDATSAKPQCIQQNCTYPITCSNQEMSEDCLYLNIYTPLDATVLSKKAVMVFIHGGNFEWGSGTVPTYNGENLASVGDVILVTINYRLGALGFLVAGSGPDSIVGNYGIRDQKRALKWIRENINCFGGDPKRITIFGQSAGAASIAVHLMSKTTQKYFDQTILQSFPSGIQLRSLNAAEKQGRLLARLLGCKAKDVACLKRASATDIMLAQQQTGPGINSYFNLFLPWAPHIDGTTLKNDYIDVAKNGMFLNKPTIIGTTVDETVADVYDGFPPTPLDLATFLIRFYRKCGVKAQTLSSLLSQYVCPDMLAIFNQYQPVDVADTRRLLVDVSSDVIYNCPTRIILQSNTAENNVWTYVFNKSLPLVPGVPVLAKCRESACHSSDLPYVFNTFDLLPNSFFTPDISDLQLANQMIRFWSNFAKYGNPNGRDENIWPRFESSADQQNYLVIQEAAGSYVLKNYKQSQCPLWDQIGL